MQNNATETTGSSIRRSSGSSGSSRPRKKKKNQLPIGFGVLLAMIIIGLLLSSLNLVYLGIAFFGLSTVFQAVTLPVEFDASRRAIQILGNTGILYGDEIRDTKKVLSAAAMTYVAAAAASILSLLRLLILFGGRRNRD